MGLADYARPRSLIYGIGNVARQDDALGWAFIDWLEQAGLCPGAETRRHYQLFLEDADLFSHFDRVLFVDASMEEGLETFRLDPVAPAFDQSFTSHAVSIPATLAITQQVFGRAPKAQLLTIRGYSWDLGEGMTPEALANLAAAQTFFAECQRKAA